jgi:hypothetical protein
MSKPAILTVDDPMVSAAITQDLRSRYSADDRTHLVHRYLATI